MSPSVTGEETHIRKARPCRVEPRVRVVSLESTLEVFHPIPEKRDGLLYLLLSQSILDNDDPMSMQLLQPLLIVELEGPDSLGL